MKKEDWQQLTGYRKIEYIKSKFFCELPVILQGGLIYKTDKKSGADLKILLRYQCKITIKQ